MSWLTSELSIIAIDVSKLDPFSPSYDHFFAFLLQFALLLLKNLTFCHPFKHCAQALSSTQMAHSFLVMEDMY